MTTAISKPFDQRIRIATLRVLFVLCVPLILFTSSAWVYPGWVLESIEVVGTLLIIFAVLGRFWAILYIGGHKNEIIIKDGPYSVCRHPLYFFSILGTAGFGLVLGSFVLTAFLGVAVFLILAATASREEAYLRTEFGPAYDVYTSQVPRVWPKPSLFHSEPTVLVKISTLRVNFFDALVFLGFIPLAKFIEQIKEMDLVQTWPIY
jgi:protein-S-isoprenylcysteine O-methyltransferase Ste14